MFALRSHSCACHAPPMSDTGSHGDATCMGSKIITWVVNGLPYTTVHRDIDVTHSSRRNRRPKMVMPNRRVALRLRYDCTTSARTPENDESNNTADDAERLVLLRQHEIGAGPMSPHLAPIMLQSRRHDNDTCDVIRGLTRNPPMATDGGVCSNYLFAFRLCPCPVLETPRPMWECVRPCLSERTRQPQYTTLLREGRKLVQDLRHEEGATSLVGLYAQPPRAVLCYPAQPRQEGRLVLQPLGRRRILRNNGLGWTNVCDCVTV